MLTDLGFVSVFYLIKVKAGKEVKTGEEKRGEKRRGEALHLS